MDLEKLLDAFDRTAANLAKLDAVWGRAAPFIPTSPAFGSPVEYDDLRRTWTDLLPGLPPINGWTITEGLPAIDDIGRAHLEYAEIQEQPWSVWEEVERPGKELAEYRFRLNRARREAVRSRLDVLVNEVSLLIRAITLGVPRASTDEIFNEDTARVEAAVQEIERLLGDGTERRGRWFDLKRHMSFSQGHDWHDVVEMDWPSVLEDIGAAQVSDTEPFEVPAIDLGNAARAAPSGAVTSALNWSNLTDDGFERLLYDIIRLTPGVQNALWLTNTRAADRGRDLSFERVVDDQLGSVRTERVIVQAKHWLSKSVSLTDVSSLLSYLELWEPPVVHTVIVATSGRFTTDAVQWVEQRNTSGERPYVQMWPESHLESLLAQRPELVMEHALR